MIDMSLPFCDWPIYTDLPLGVNAGAALLTAVPGIIPGQKRVTDCFETPVSPLMMQPVWLTVAFALKPVSRQIAADKLIQTYFFIKQTFSYFLIDENYFNQLAFIFNGWRFNFNSR
jgi:hypothetical protein